MLVFFFSVKMYADPEQEKYQEKKPAITSTVTSSEPTSQVTGSPKVTLKEISLDTLLTEQNATIEAVDEPVVQTEGNM